MSGHRHIRAGLFLALACAIEAAAQGAAYGQSEAAWSEQVLALENEARISAGSQPLSLSPQLTAAAEQHSQSMAASGYFGHTGPDGSTPGSRILAAGYAGATAYGENIAAGFPDPQSVVQAWLASPGHRANILNPGFTQAGIGIDSAPGSAYGTYWTEDFAAGQGSMASPGTGYTLPAAPQPALQPASDGVGSQSLAIAQPVAPVTPAGPAIAQPLAPVTSAGPSIAAIGASAPAIDQPASALALYGSGFGSQPGWVLAGRRLLPVDYWSDQLVLVQMLPGISGWTGIAVVRPDERASNTVYVEIGY